MLRKNRFKHFHQQKPVVLSIVFMSNLLWTQHFQEDFQMFVIKILKLHFLTSWYIEYFMFWKGPKGWHCLKGAKKAPIISPPPPYFLFVFIFHFCLHLFFPFYWFHSCLNEKSEILSMVWICFFYAKAIFLQIQSRKQSFYTSFMQSHLFLPINKYEK